MNSLKIAIFAEFLCVVVSGLLGLFQIFSGNFAYSTFIHTVCGEMRKSLY